MRELVLIRGLPGAGKSTLAKVLANDSYPVFSVDDYFTDPETQHYHFEFDKNYLAYQQCEERTAKAMKEGIPKIFIHNTFTLDWEMDPYFKLASRFNYRVHVITVENYHGGRNIHDIKEEQLEKMADKYKVKLL